VICLEECLNVEADMVVYSRTDLTSVVGCLIAFASCKRVCLVSVVCWVEWGVYGSLQLCVSERPFRCPLGCRSCSCS
jgi:hypothetical protein